MSAYDDVIEAVKVRVADALDNLNRATSFRRAYPEAVDRMYGFSGKTLGTLIGEYEQELDKWTAALAWAQEAHDGR